MIKSNRRNNGFTLIELLVVVLILGILLAIAIPSYLSSVATSKLNTCNSNAKTIAVAVQAQYVKAGGGSYLLWDGATIDAQTGLKNDLSNNVPVNPCLATPNTTIAGYGTIVGTATGWTLTPAQGTCASAPPAVALGG